MTDFPNSRARPSIPAVGCNFVDKDKDVGGVAFFSDPANAGGENAPWYLIELRALGYVPFVVVVLVVPWLAGAGQLTALASGRYAPYPAAGERPALGPVRRVIRRVVLGRRARRRTPAERRRALGG